MTAVSRPEPEGAPAAVVCTFTRDACGVVIVTVRGPLDHAERPVLCRAVQDELRRPVRRLVLDLGATGIDPPAVTTAARIADLCAAHQVGCTVVVEDRGMLAKALADNTPSGVPGPVLATTLAAALTAGGTPCAAVRAAAGAGGGSA